MKLLKKPFVYAGIFSLLLLLLDAGVLLKTFIIPSAITSVTEQPNTTDIDTNRNTDTNTDSNTNSNTDSNPNNNPNNNTDTDSSSQDATITETSYQDDNIQISLETFRKYDATIYVADITLSSADYLKTALAQNTFGTNITEKTSELAEEKNAIFAINGDYYGANNRGYVIKNGVLYRSTIRENSDYGDLVIYQDGTFGIIDETQISADQLIQDGVTNLFAFGPTLIKDSTITVSEHEEVGRAMSSNPRTAIGIVDSLHYIVLVSDGRTSESEGLSLYEVAEIMQEYGCSTAYNLDGGGSSTMYFNGQIINNPTTNGRKISERSVSDIVYIGY
ncbi:MAG TPA: phosphodiester glycosidase family protein [Candidatus Scybalomonas excrementigallinarum]|nr:phosphodiester glycosidase family protein [Candidatus Scybalomonas excrementigallinarum]